MRDAREIWPRRMKRQKKRRVLHRRASDRARASHDVFSSSRYSPHPAGHRRCAVPHESRAIRGDYCSAQVAKPRPDTNGRRNEEKDTRNRSAIDLTGKYAFYETKETDLARRAHFIDAISLGRDGGMQRSIRRGHNRNIIMAMPRIEWQRAGGDFAPLSGPCMRRRDGLRQCHHYDLPGAGIAPA